MNADTYAPLFSDMPRPDLFLILVVALFLIAVLARKPEVKKPAAPPAGPNFIKGYVINKQYYCIGRTEDGHFVIGEWKKKDDYAYGDALYRTFEHAEMNLLSREVKPMTPACSCAAPKKPTEADSGATKSA